MALQRRGIDVTTSTDAGLLRAPDQEQLAYAVSEGRVIFTQDADFLRLHATGAPHTGIAYCHPEKRSLGEIIREPVLLWEIYDRDEMTNRIEFL
ncbi:MAG: DUF5615 family PIN-like protein [Isosphaeraceae bacterium]|nr:DUF5615 family PIN-like protein [Isosphaeraceae bacterium]